MSDFGLVDAIESGITKIPRLPATDNTGRPEPQYFKLWQHVTANLAAGEKFTGGKPKPEVVYRKAQAALLTLAGQWQQRMTQINAAAPGEDRTPPVMIVVCDNTDIAEHFYRVTSGEETVQVEADDADDAADEKDDDDGEDAGNTAARRRKKAKPVKRYGDGLPGFPELWNRAGAEVTLRIDSNLLKTAESEGPGASRKEAAEELRRIVSTIGRPGAPGAHIRCVVSVNMLSEGWDANNVTHILGLRAFHSQLLCEQVVGRGLRRMDYTPDPETGLLTAEYVDVFGVPFSLIPFKSQPPGPGPLPEDRVEHEVLALPARAAFDIRFPVVEGFVVDLQRHRVVCDVDAMQVTQLDPWSVPTAAFVRPQVGYAVGVPSAQSGFGFELMTREVYYRESHPQTIAFEITREVVRQLTDAAHPGSERLRATGRATLFPQVLAITQRYIERRVDFNGCHHCELGLQTYAERVLGLLVAAIRPDTAQGEPPLLPRLNRYRPIGSSTAVRFKTVKPVQSTQASHLNCVAADTGSWEQAAATQLEIKGAQQAVNRWGKLGRWGFLACYELQLLLQTILQLPGVRQEAATLTA